MTKIKSNIIMYTYFEDELQILLNNETIPQIKIEKNIQTDIQTQLKNWLNITITSSQIIKQSINNNIEKNIILNTWLCLNHEQFKTIVKNMDKQKNLSFMEVNHLLNLEQKEKNLIQQGKKTLANGYKLNGLIGMQEILPQEFTTYSLSSLLRNITNTNIKPNNLYRELKDQIIIIKKDRSHKGRPKSVFVLKDKVKH